MTDLLWFLTRSSGIVALVLIVAAVADGLLFSGRTTGRRRRPNWWLDLHRGLGGYALIFTGLHLATAFGADIGVTLASIFVPGAAEWSTTAYTLGVVAFYAMAVTVLTTWPKRRLRRKVWHALHVLSVPAAVLAGIHGYQLGTDAHTGWYTALTVALVGIGTYPLALRLIGVAQKRAAAATATPAPTAATAVTTGARPHRPAAIDPLLSAAARPTVDDDQRHLVGAGR